MLSNNLTVCILCYNDERRIEVTINNFVGKFPLVVMDDANSNDNTSQICKKLGVEYIKLDKHGFVESEAILNAAWGHIKTDYMLRAHCSEYVPTDLLLLYAKVANEKNYDVVCAARVSITAGKHIVVWGDARKSTKGLVSPRFSKRGSIDYKNNIIHQEGKIICNQDRILKASKNIHLMFYQFRDYDSSWSEIVHVKYNDANAMQLYQNGERYCFFKMIFISLKFFLIEYFYHGSYKQGHLGFMHSYYRFHLNMGIYLRLWDIEHNLQKEQISELHNSIRTKLLSKEIYVESLFE